MVVNRGADFVVSCCPDFSYGCECRYFGSGGMPGSGREQGKNKCKKHVEIGVCLIVFGGLSLELFWLKKSCGDLEFGRRLIARSYSLAVPR